MVIVIHIVIAFIKKSTILPFFQFCDLNCSSAEAHRLPYITTRGFTVSLTMISGSDEIALKRASTSASASAAAPRTIERVNGELHSSGGLQRCLKRSKIRAVIADES